MPTSIPSSSPNEFGRRFCYIRHQLDPTIYMTQFLRLGDAERDLSTRFQVGPYFFPSSAPIVSDVLLGEVPHHHGVLPRLRDGLLHPRLRPRRRGPHARPLLRRLRTGGIKPCVSTNVGDQFTGKNQHLIERAFSYFYFAINAGSSISIFFCPVWLRSYGPRVAFASRP